MNYKITFTELFLLQAKRLSKKYSSLKSDLETLQPLLEANPELGISLGNNIYKIRLAIKSKGKGKSGGARIIAFLKHSNTEIYLLTIYDKSEIENIDINYLKELVRKIKK
jgi:hypothetical protein